MEVTVVEVKVASALLDSRVEAKALAVVVDAVVVVEAVVVVVEVVVAVVVAVVLLLVAVVLLLGVEVEVEVEIGVQASSLWTDKGWWKPGGQATHVLCAMSAGTYFVFAGHGSCVLQV